MRDENQTDEPGRASRDQASHPAGNDLRARAFVRWTLKHGGRLWVLAALLGIVGAFGTARLYARLNGELEALLPRDAPSVRAIDEMRKRVLGLQSLGVIVDTGDAARLPAGEKFLDDLAAKVADYGPDLVRAVHTGYGAEQAFLQKHAPLYLDLDDLTEIHRRIDARKRWEASKQFGSLLDDEPAPPVDFADLHAKYERRGLAAGGSEAGAARFSSARKHLTLLLIEGGNFATGANQSRTLLEQLKRDIAALGGTDRYAPGMRFGFTGDVAVSVEEISGLETDLTASSIVVLMLVVVVILLYYRWRPSILAAGVPLLVATLCTFTLVQLPPFGIDELNSNTAFLGSIVVGNGINFGLMLLARYLERRRAGQNVESALVEAVHGSYRPTLVAAVAAGASYGSLVVTDFRGFRQFGVVGGVGMVLCWISSYVLMPPLLAWLDKGRRQVRLDSQDGAATIAAPLATFVLRRARVITAVSLFVSLVAGLQLRHLSIAQLESDLSRLRRRDTWTMGEGYWGQRMDDLLGRYLSPTVLLADSEAQTAALAKRLREAMTHPPLSELIAEVRTVDDVLPRRQDEKVAVVARIRRLLTPVVRAELAADQLATIDRFLTGPLEPITEKDLPPALRSLLRERDGSIGKVVLVYPKTSRKLWQTETLMRYTDELRKLAAADPGMAPARVAGALPLSADLLRAISRDGPIATMVAMAAVALIVFLMLGPGREAIAVMGSLLVGVLWMTGATFGLGIKINFANFIAFPITFGIGVDYAVNVAQRAWQDGRRDLWPTIRWTGGAVVLCSMTTMIGYSSLLMAQNRALFLFGAIAVLGEVMCVSVAIVALPGLLHVLAAKRPDSRPRGVGPRDRSEHNIAMQGKVPAQSDDRAGEDASH